MLYYALFVIICGVCYRKRNEIIMLWNLYQSLNLTNKINPPNEMSILENVGFLKYNYKGNQYNMFIPFDKNYEIEMNDYKVELTREGKQINITHQAGIPYLFTAKMLGGDNICITNEYNDKIHNYGNENPPYYGIEVM